MGLLPRATKAYRFLPVCLFIFLLPSVSLGQQQNSYSDALIESARALHLDRKREWRVLLHYPDSTGSYSKIDDPAFFLASNGKSNPEAELFATIQGLFEPAELADKHPICRFPARYEWLKYNIGIDKKYLPAPECTEQFNYLSKVNPKSASVMFPSAYMNSPASMFGHTFIRIGNEYESELLSYAVNYAAQTDENNGMVYAWKGVFGLYKGYFSILPHYAKIREYSNLEHRDIWEYKLNLTTDEVRRMALHIWELRDIYSDYYFFDENCSYNLLFLLEAARPTVHLTDKTAPWVVPLDTIFLIRSSGLISSTAYRPSQRQKIQTITQLMNSDEITLGQRLASGKDNPDNISVALPPDQTILVFDLAIELLQHSYGKQQINQEDYRKRLMQLLKKRSQMANPLNNSYQIPQPIRPEQGHSSVRVSLGGGFERGKLFSELGVRPAYHGMTDPGAGYLDGAQIEFMDTAIRYYPHQELVRLERLVLLDIVSLSAYDQIFKRTSWKIRAGMTQVQKKNGNDVLVFQANTGGGLTYESSLFGLTYAMAEVEGNLGQGLNDWYALGTGLSLGLNRHIGNRVQFSVNGKYLWFPLGEKLTSIQGESAVSISPNRNNSLKIKSGYTSTSQHDKLETLLLWNYFF